MERVKIWGYGAKPPEKITEFLQNKVIKSDFTANPGPYLIYFFRGLSLARPAGRQARVILYLQSTAIFL